MDFGDIYLSFIFNLLGNSLQLKQNTEDMIDASARHDTVEYFESLGALLRIILDFNSYKTAGGSLGTFIKQAAFKHDGLKGVPHVKFRKHAQEKKLNELEARIEKRLTQPKVGRGDGYSYGKWDFIQAPFALTTGALYALPAESFGNECSRYVQSSRQYMLDSRDYFGEEEQKLEGYTALHDSFSFIDNIGLQCYYAFNTDLSSQHFSDLFADPKEFGINILYNLGYQWVDVQNYLFYTPETVPQGDWGFFIVYLFGDFMMRFFYRDDSAATV